MKLNRHTALLAAAALGIPCGTAAAEPTARVEYRDAFTTRAAGAPSGRVFHDEFFAAGDASAKPPAVQHVHVQLPKGARFHTDAAPVCSASDAELMADGPAACDPRSQVGSEVFSFDTGVDGPNRIETNDIAFLNNTGELIILSQERQSGARVVIRGKLTRDTLDIELPPLPGTPPDGGADRQEDATFPASAWLTTPPECPSTGAWAFRVDYTFRNGEKVTRTSDSPCNPARIAFFHRQHGRAMKVYSSAASTARLRIFRGARRVYGRSVQLRAGVNRVPLPSLASGTYRLELGGGRATLAIR